MRVIVTGGAGYVGRVAVELLHHEGHDVVVFDNFYTGHRSSFGSDIEVIEMDLRDAEGVERAVGRAKADAIMHFAAVTIVPESVRNPGLYYAVNAAGTNHLLMAAVANGIERFVLSSTAAVYGTPETSLVREDAPLLPISPYGSSKQMAEQMVRDFSVAHGLMYAIFRYFNVAGATEANGEDHTPETHLIPSAIFAAMGRRDPLVLFGQDYPTPDGTAVRDYIHVADLARAHIMALEWVERNNGIFNLGGGTGASVAEIVATIERVTGHKVPVEHGPRREGDPPVLVADISRATSELGWVPEQSDLESIVMSAWSWHERHPHGYAGR